MGIRTKVILILLLVIAFILIGALDPVNSFM